MEQVAAGNLDQHSAKRIGLFAVPPPLPDAAIRDAFERALETALIDALLPYGDSPMSAQLLWHFGIGVEGARRSKRLRPMFLLAAAFEEGATFDDALDAALAIEILHNYSLVHDDIEDGDRLRHGRETVWARYGLAHGVNAGDALSALCHLTLLRNTAALPADRVTAMALVLHRTQLRMCADQSRDLAFERASCVSMNAYLEMIEGKTAALFGAACALGVLCAGASDARVAMYAELGRDYGRAFQILDDVAGTWGTCEQTGKRVCGDIARRKLNFPIVWALGGPPSAQRECIAARYAVNGPLEPRDIAEVVEALDVLGARRAAENACAEYVAHAARLAREYGIDGRRVIEAIFSAAAARVGNLTAPSVPAPVAGPRSRGRAPAPHR